MTESKIRKTIESTFIVLVSRHLFHSEEFTLKMKKKKRQETLLPYEKIETFSNTFLVFLEWYAIFTRQIFDAFPFCLD